MSEWIRVLVIEDDAIVQEALKHSLKLYGFKAYPAKNGRTGLKLTRAKKPELILLDWMIPGMDGLEVLAELKHHPKTEHISLSLC